MTDLKKNIEMLNSESSAEAERIMEKGLHALQEKKAHTYNNLPFVAISLFMIVIYLFTYWIINL